MRRQIKGLCVLSALFVSAGVCFYCLREEKQCPVQEGISFVEWNDVSDPVVEPESVGSVAGRVKEEPVPLRESWTGNARIEPRHESGAVASESAAFEYASLLEMNPLPGMTRQEWRSKINAIMDVLGAQATPPNGYADVLISISEDPNRDIVVRDYALQHMVSIFESFEEDRSRMKDALYRALDDKQSSLPGTALLALNRLSRRYPEIDSGRVGESALIVAGDEEYGVMGRITALQLCAALDVPAVVPAAKKILENPGNPLLRRSARTALEQIGEKHPDVMGAIGPLVKQENCDDCP